MFEILDDQMRLDEDKVSTKRERMMLWAGIGLVSVVLFGALYFGLSLVSW